jgi:hypothetical protein
VAPQVKDKAGTAKDIAEETIHNQQELRNGTEVLGSVFTPPPYNIRPKPPAEPRTPHSRCGAAA